MKKSYVVILLLIFSCKSVDNWEEKPVLLQNTVKEASTYVTEQKAYIELVQSRLNMDVKENLSIEQLDHLLAVEKDITLSSQRVMNSWFDFYLKLREDPGFSEALNGHYYLKKAITALNFSEQMKLKNQNKTLRESKLYDEINLLEEECRLSIGEIVAYNNTQLDPEFYYKQLKKIYKQID
ncbi:MAG: hypothetical protein OCD02_08880 [Spirochaetaceae bacterium]